MCQPYIESATTPSDYEKFAKISGFCWAAEMDFHHLAGHRVVSVHLQYDILCLLMFVYGIPT